MRVALTGGIASGKSTVADVLSSLGAEVIDADVLARSVVAPGTAGLAAIRARFGDGVLAPAGDLDRRRLGEIVFDDPVARRDLEAIVHPLVRERAAAIEASLGTDRIVVHVIPLLVETGQGADFDRVVVVDVPDEVQMGRLMERNGLSVGEAEARLAAQATRAQRLAVADDVIDNSGGRGRTAAAATMLWRRWIDTSPGSSGSEV